METDKKTSGKMAKGIVNVRTKWFTFFLLILILFGDSTGKLFWNDGGDKGELKDKSMKGREK